MLRSINLWGPISKSNFWLSDADLVIDITTQAGEYISGAVIFGYEPGDLGLVFNEKISPYLADGVRWRFDAAEPAWEEGHKALLNNGAFGSIQQASDFII